MEQPIKHRRIINESMLEPINIRNYLTMKIIEQVTCGEKQGMRPEFVTLPEY